MKSRFFSSCGVDKIEKKISKSFLLAEFNIRTGGLGVKTKVPSNRESFREGASAINEPGQILGAKNKKGRAISGPALILSLQTFNDLSTLFLNAITPRN